MFFKLKLLLFLSLMASPTLAQIEEVNPPSYIKTITFKGSQQESQLPILRLGEPLRLEFDALNGNEEDYYYVIEHFNYDWTPSPLVKSEYLSGFDNQRIFTYENSFNTYQIYSHYRLSIPNQQTRALLKTGNYIISIWNDRDEMMFSRKFMIYEEQVAVGVAIRRSRDVKLINETQTVDIIINSNGINFNNPLETVNTLIIQNNNLNTAIQNVKPQYTLGNELIFKYRDATTFWAGNEYRYFETRDVRAANAGVQFIDLKDLYHSYLFVDGIRYNQPYTYNPDINGNFVITAENVRDPSIEADYTFVHFALQYPSLSDGEKLYVYGNYNNYALEEENRLRYNPDTNLYECAFRIKQGFYSYKYVLVDKNNELIEGAVSGNFWQTENNYKVLVYYKDLGARYDRLIGVGEATSVDITN